MKLVVLINSLSAIKELADLPFKAVVSFRLKKFLLSVSEHEKAYTDARAVLFERYGTPDVGGNTISIKKEHLDVFQHDMAELLDEEIELNIPEITISDFGDITIEPSKLLQLEWLIKE